MRKQRLLLALLIFNLSLVRGEGEDDEKKPAVPADPIACSSKVPFSYIASKQPMNSPIKVDEKLEKICPNYKRLCCQPDEMVTGHESYVKFVGSLKSLEAVVIRLIEYFENINLNKLGSDLNEAQKTFGDECKVVAESRDSYSRSILTIKNALKNKATVVQAFQDYIKEQQKYFSGFYCMICRTNLQDIVEKRPDGRIALKIQNNICVKKFNELIDIESTIKLSNAASILARGVACANKQELGYLKAINSADKVSQMIGYIKQCLKSEYGTKKADSNCEADCDNLTKVTTFNLFPHMYYFPDLSYKIISKYYPPIKAKGKEAWTPAKIEELSLTPADDFVVYPVTGSPAWGLETYEPLFKGDGINLYTIPTNFEKIIELVRPPKKETGFTIDWSSPIVWGVIGGTAVLVIVIIVVSCLCCGKKKKTK